MNKNSDFYQKKGNLNYKERTMLESIKKRVQSNPELSQNITPASNFDELKRLHAEITSDVVEEIKEEIPTEIKNETMEKPFIDPLNREEPNVRDYVMDDKFDPFADFQKSNKSAFGEPQSYDQAFEFPTDEELRNTNASSNTQSNQKPQRPVNSNSGQQGQSGDAQKDKRKAKRFAKTIVDLVCGLMEVGFVWYATKDINPNKLTEYELNGEMDLSALVELPDGTEATIKQYFINQLGEIEVASKISAERREQLTEDLTEVFIENNIQPSANMNMAISGLTLVAEQGIKISAIVSTNNQLLNQLRERKMESTPYQYAETPEPVNNYPKQEEVYSAQPTKNNYQPSRKKKRSYDISEDELNEMDNRANELSLLTEVPTKE
jgi:hypothetical protein